MRFIVILSLFLTSLNTCFAFSVNPKHSASFTSVMANISSEIQFNQAGKDFTSSLVKMNQLVTKVNEKYDGKPYVKFILGRIFELKLKQIRDEEDISTKVHLKNIQKSLNRALERSPTDFYPKAVRHLLRMPKKQFAKVLNMATTLTTQSTEEESTELYKRRESRFPLAERIVGHLAIIFSIGAALMDTCGVVPVALCQVLFAISMVALGFWVVDISRLALGIGQLSVEDVLFF